MRMILTVSALVLVGLPASAQTSAQGQVTQEELNRCGTHNGIPYEKVIEYCTQLIESGRLSPTSLAALYSTRGDAYEKMGQYDQEIADDTRAIQINPNSANAYNNRAWAYHLKGQDAKGLADAQKAVTLDPKYGSALETRAEIYEKLGQLDKAIADYRSTLRFPPTHDSSIEDAKAALKRLGATP